MHLSYPTKKKTQYFLFIYVQYTMRINMITRLLWLSGAHQE